MEMEKTKEREIDDDDIKNEDDMNNIIKYINDLDYDKYQRDLEIREAFHLLKNKMEKEEKEKTKLTETNDNELIKLTEATKERDDKGNEPIDKQEEPLTMQEEKNPIRELTDNEKQILEQNWNTSTKIAEDNKDQEAMKESKETKKQIEKLYNNEKKKLAVHSYQSFQKLLQRQGVYNFNFPIKNSLRIAVTNDRDPIVKSKIATIPFLIDEPYI